MVAMVIMVMIFMDMVIMVIDIMGVDIMDICHDNSFMISGITFIYSENSFRNIYIKCCDCDSKICKAC